MPIENLLATIDAEIAKLQQARTLIAGTGKVTLGGKPASIAPPKKAKRKRTLTPEARKRIADAQRKRWAAAKKTTAA
jgi:hypothetical protein